MAAAGRSGALARPGCGEIERRGLLPALAAGAGVGPRTAPAHASGATPGSPQAESHDAPSGRPDPRALRLPPRRGQVRGRGEVDGLGGHLVHALASAESNAALNPLVPQLKLAIEDLRLIIDSLDPYAETFDSVFASLRARLAHTANSLGIRFRWEVDDSLASLELNAHEVLTLARIMQEAVTNVIKHAQATELSIIGSLNPVSREVRFSVVDNGVGIRAPQSNGRGINSMQVRAAELGGSLVLESRGTGTQVDFCWTPKGQIG